MLGYGREELLAEEQGRQSHKQRILTQAQGAKYIDGVRHQPCLKGSQPGEGVAGAARESPRSPLLELISQVSQETS